MRILIVGAGAIGGYFGGRLLEKGKDVTFLVREKRKSQLDQNGLIIESIHGNINLYPKTLLSGEKADPFDVILLSTKSYHLHGAMESLHPYVGKNTMILPLLNGVAHFQTLIEEFGDKNVLGGLCFIETTLNEEGKIIQTSPIHDFVFGERNSEITKRILQLQEAFSGTKATFRLSENIEKDIWQKYLFISTLAGVTSLFHSSIGPIRDEPYGIQTIRSVLQEIATIMRVTGAPITHEIEELQYNRLFEIGYDMKASLQRDVEKHLPTEADHFFGYLLTIAEKENISAPLLSTIYTNLKIYEKLI